MKLAWTITLCGLFSFRALAFNQEKQIQLLKNPKNKTTVVKEDIIPLERLENMFTMDAKTPGLTAMLKRHSMKHRQKAVPVLIKVIKVKK